MARRGFLKKRFERIFNRTQCYCAFCKSPRIIYRKKTGSFTNLFLSLIGASCLMFVIFHEWHPMGMFFWLVFSLTSEVFLSLRWRMSLVCGACGFDPLLYLKDPDHAATKVKLRLEERRQRPGMILSQPLKLPTISKERLEVIEKAKKRQSGQIVSRQV